MVAWLYYTTICTASSNHEDNSLIAVAGLMNIKVENSEQSEWAVVGSAGQGQIIHKGMWARAKEHQPLAMATTGGAPYERSFTFLFFRKLLDYSLEIVERPYITRYWILISQK